MTFEKKEEKKQREKHPLIINGKNLDDLAKKIREVTPCNRKKIIEIGMIDFFQRYSDTEICVMISGGSFEEKLKNAGFDISEIIEKDENVVIP